MQPFFSIVMPAYNAERYIEQAILSIQNQTYSDWEFIIVDDASQDTTSEIVQRYAAQDTRIRLHTRSQNGGVSMARNSGMKEAKGRYLWIADADDYAEPNLLEIVHQSLQENPAQYVVFGLIEEYYNEKEEFLYSHSISHKQGYYRTPEELRKEIITLEQKTLYGYTWNKMYEVAHIRTLGLEFEVDKLIDDILFNIAYAMDIQSMNVIDQCMYHYGKRIQQNLTNEFTPDYYKFHRKRIEKMWEQMKYWGEDTEETKAILGALYGRYILSTLQRNCDKRAQMNLTARKAWCKKLYKDELYNTLIPSGRAEDSTALRIFLWLLRNKCTLACLGMGRIVQVVRTGLPQLYSKTKSKR